MFEGGVLPHDPAGGAAGTLSAPTQGASAGAVACAEDVAGPLGSLAADDELAGMVERLLARLLVTTQSPSDDEGSDADGDGSDDSEDLFAGESGTDAALVAAAEGHRVISVEETGTSGIVSPGTWGLGELVAACHRLAVWAS